MDQLFLRLLKLSGAGWDATVRENPDVQSALVRNEQDIVLNHLASLDRSLLVKFWFLPVRLCLGAACPRAFVPDQKYRDRLQRSLIDRETRDPKLRLRLIAVRESVGHRYCRDRLGMTEDSLILLDSRDLKGFAETLDKEAHAGTGGTPILIDEELSILNLLGNPDLNGGGRFVSLMPLTTQRSIRSNDLRRESTAYFVSIACSRKNVELRDFLEDALQTLLLTEIETTSRALAQLYDDLLEVSRSAVPFFPDFQLPSDLPAARAATFWEAHDWAAQVVNVKRRAAEAFCRSHPQWAPILARTREIVQENLSAKAETIEQVVRLIVGHETTRLTESQRDQIEEIFDCDLNLTRNTQRFVDLGTRHLASLIQHRLRGRTSAPELDVELQVGEGEGIEQPLAKQAEAQMTELLAVYRGLRGELQAADVASLATDINAYIRKNDCRYLAATVSAAHAAKGIRADLAGGVLLLADDAHRALELRHLWIGPTYRGFGIAEKLIRRAADMARQEDRGRVIVKFYDEYRASEYFRRLGFNEFHRSPRADDEPLILELPHDQDIRNYRAQ